MHDFRYALRFASVLRKQRVMINRLRWTQLVVAIATTILAGLVWPGVMVVISVSIGVIYIDSAIGAIRDWRPLVWTACVLSAGVAILSTTAVVSNDFAVLRIDSQMGEPPKVAVSPTGGLIALESIPDDVLAEMHSNYASDVKRQRVTVGLLLLVSLGSCAVVLLHLYAWQFRPASRERR